MPSAKEELAKRAAQADSLIAQLRSEITEVRNSLFDNFYQLEEKRLFTENIGLKQQVEDWKKKLIELEISHGIKQFDLPSTTVQVSKVIEPAASESNKVSKVTDNVSQRPEKTPCNDKKPAKTKEAKKPGPSTPTTEVIDVSRLDLRIGRIVDINKHPDADALYVEQIDVGEEKPRTIISGLVKHIKLEDLQNRLVMVLCNLKPVKMRGIASEGMVMCASATDKIEVLCPPNGSQVGDLVSCEGFEGKPDPQLNPKKKVFELIAPDLKTNEQFEATYKGSPLIVKGKGVIKASTLANAPVK